MNRAALALLIASVGLGIAGIASIPRKSSGGSDVIIDPSPCDFGTLASGQSMTVYVRIRNPADSPINIAGASRLCSKQGCLQGVGLPIDIPANDEARVGVEIVGTQPGPFSLALPLYIVDGGGGHRRIPVRITGKVEAVRAHRAVPRS